MACLNQHHKVLTNGKGKCSVPMWSGGCPAGFCDRDAFGFPTKNSKYDGYVPALACPIHGGPPCPGIEIEPGVFSGCSGTGGDCPVCGK